MADIDQQIMDKIQQAVDEKLGGDYVPHSFVAPSNTNVDDIQFVYVVEGITAPAAVVQAAEALEVSETITQGQADDAAGTQLGDASESDATSSSDQDADGEVSLSVYGTTSENRDTSSAANDEDKSGVEQFIDRLLDLFR